MSGLKNVLIGVFVLIAFSIIVFILLFLHPSVGDSGKILSVRFTDIDKVTIGTRVTYAGLAVGEVVDIKEIPDARTDRIDRNGDVYVYELTLRVDSSVHVYNTDVVSTRTSGLLGERNVAIDPQPLKQGEELYLIDDQIIYAEPSTNIEDTLKSFEDLSKKFGTLLDNVNTIVLDVKREQIVEKISRTTDNVFEITDAINQPEKLDAIVNNVWTLTERAKHSWNTIDASLDNFYDLTERAHRSWSTIDDCLGNFKKFSVTANESWDAAFREFRAAGINAREFTHQIRQIINHTSQGKGTIGQLFIKDDLYLRLKSILHKGDTVMNDVNRYGILFHSSKQWQRINARRMNLLNRLSTPEQFSLYFNNEIDRLSTSLSQVSMVLNESECYPYGLMCQPGFSETFSDVIRKVENIEESLKMYNEQVIDQENGCSCN